MDSNQGRRQKLALVFGNLPTVEEIDQFRLLQNQFEITVVTSESVCGYLTQTSWFNDLNCLALPDHAENHTYLPGLERALSDFDIVVVKERLGLYAYQAVKAKWRSRFRLAIWVDNLTVLPGDDVSQMRTVRREVSAAADMFIVQTNAARCVLQLEGIEDQRIVTMPPYVEARFKRTKKLRAKAFEKCGFAESDFVIAHVGQIEWEEGLANLATALKVLVKTEPSTARRIRLLFCGIGTFAPQLRETLMALGLEDRASYLAPSREAFEIVTAGADAMFFSTIPSRDRIEGDPYRLMYAMANEIPLIASRSALVEEYCGKHRIDFCANSPESLADAISKAQSATALRNDVVRKNAATVESRFNREKVTAQMLKIMDRLKDPGIMIDASIAAFDHQVLEVEARVTAKQYLAAINLIETIFQQPNVPVHHKANLYRLIGDCFAKLGDNDAAKDAYIKVVELDPYSAKAYIGLGTVGLIKASNDIAVLHFQKAVSLSPEDEMANLGLGLAFQGMEELAEASRWVVKAVEINPDNTAGLFTLVKIAYDRNHFAEAETALSRYVTRHPQDHNMMYTLAGLLFKSGRYADVVEITQQIINADPLDSRAHALAKQARNALVQAKATSSNG